MSKIEGPNSDKIYERISSEKEKISELQERWDTALNALYSYYKIPSGGDEKTQLRNIEKETLNQIEKSDGKKIILGFAGPGGAGKGTVREQIKEPLKTGEIVNSTTRDKRPYEIDKVHYNFLTTTDIAERIVLTENSLNIVQNLLCLDEKPTTITNTHLNEIEHIINKKFQNGELEEGIDLEPSNEDLKNEFLNLTLRPLRGWYALSKNDLISSSGKYNISSFEESGPNLLKIANNLKIDGIYLNLIYVLPEQPIAFTMAERALKRDGHDQSIEKLLSTIGGRQIAEFEEMTNMLISNNYDDKLNFILLVNDTGYENNDQFITRAGDALIDKLI